PEEPPSPMDVAPARGLGEQGPAPAPLDLGPAVFDSILGTDPEEVEASEDPPAAAEPEVEAPASARPATFQPETIDLYGEDEAPPAVAEATDAPEAPPAVAKAPEVPEPPPTEPEAPVAPAPTGAPGEVVFVDDEAAQFELGRRMQLVQTGWMVNGEVVCGNHRGADLVLPENRIRPDQTLVPRDYFRLKVRGRR